MCRQEAAPRARAQPEACGGRPRCEGDEYREHKKLIVVVYPYENPS